MARAQTEPDEALWGELRAILHQIPGCSPRELSRIFLRFSSDEREQRVKPYLRGALQSCWEEWCSAWPERDRYLFDMLAGWIWEANRAQGDRPVTPAASLTTASRDELPDKARSLRKKRPQVQSDLFWSTKRSNQT